MEVNDAFHAFPAFSLVLKTAPVWVDTGGFLLCYTLN
jgi:hypothetical protein